MGRPLYSRQRRNLARKQIFSAAPGPPPPSLAAAAAERGVSQAAQREQLRLHLRALPGRQRGQAALEVHRRLAAALQLHQDRIRDARLGPWRAARAQLTVLQAARRCRMRPSANTLLCMHPVQRCRVGLPDEHALYNPGGRSLAPANGLHIRRRKQIPCIRSVA